MTFKGLPESISHAAIIEAVEALGVDPECVSTVTIDPSAGKPSCIVVTVMAFEYDEGGRRFTEDGERYRKHEVKYEVPFHDEEPTE